MHARLSAILLLALAPPATAQVVERWVQRYDGPENGAATGSDAAWAVTVDGRGNVIVTGDSVGIGTGRDMYTAKYGGADGTLLWEQRFHGPGSNPDIGRAVAVDGSGDVIVTGGSVSLNEMAGAIYTAKYAGHDGALLWEQRYSGQGQRQESAHALALDGSGNVIVTGVTTDNNHEFDCYTAKYAAVDGALLWEKRYDGPANGEDMGNAVAVDADGNVVVTGRSIGIGTLLDIFTAKYAATDGALLWERRYNGPANENDEAWQVAVDSNGNVIIAGTATGSAGRGRDGFDAYTAKYAAADGAVLWENLFDGSGNGAEILAGLGLDSSGNAIVTGLSSPGFYTAKYAAKDGALLWEQRRMGSGAGESGGHAVVVDASGNACVTGSLRSIGSGVDIYSATYAAADGALLWEKVYNGPAGRDESMPVIALTPDSGAAVAGWSNNAAGYPDFITVYYAPAATAQPAWRRQYFATVDNTGNAADNADPDKDGIPNLIEWACGLNPNLASSPPATPLHDGQDLVVLYRRSKAAVSAGAVFTVESNSSLSGNDWQSNGVREAILSDDGAFQQVRATIPAGIGNHFARLRVRIPP